MKDYKIYIDILVGRPGSGKSVYANDYVKNSYESGSIQIIDCDEYTTNKKRYDSCSIGGDGFGSFIRQNSRNIYDCLKWWTKRRYIIDGLFNTEESRTNLINKLLSEIAYVSKCKQTYFKYSVDIKFIVWRDNIEACLANDRKRAEKEGKKRSAEVTIKNMVVEPVNVELYKDYNNVNDVTVEYRDVYAPTDNEEKIMSKASWNETKFLKSDTWSLGGTWCGYDGSETQCNAGEPVEFAEFDDLLLEVCPNMSFLQYKKIRRECVEQMTEYHHDYYGGSTEEAYWQCDLQKLYKLLVDMKLMEA